MTDDNYTVEYTGGAKEVRHVNTGLSATRDDPQITGLSDAERDDLLATGLFEVVSDTNTSDEDGEEGVADNDDTESTE